MKKCFTVSTLFVFITLLSVNTSYPQFKFSLGPAVGMNFNIHTGSDLSETGTGFGAVFAGQADMQFSKTIGMIATLGFYDNRSGSTNDTKTESYEGIPITVSSDVSSSLAYFTIEPLLKVSLPSSGLYFLAGPSIGINIEGSYDLTQDITIPQEYANYYGLQAKTTQKSSQSFNDLVTRFEFKFGAGYDIPIARNIDLAPQVTFGYGLTKVQKDVSWRILTIQAICGLKFRLI